MTFHSPDLQTNARTLGEVERIRALVMNIHGMLRGTDAARRVDEPIENIHRALDRLEEAVQHRMPAAREVRMSLPHY